MCAEKREAVSNPFAFRNNVLDLDPQVREAFQKIGVVVP